MVVGSGMSRMSSCRACGVMIAADATTCRRCGAALNRNSVGMITVLLTALAIVTLFVLSIR